MNIDEIYLLRCLELARKGSGKTRQNPMVGSVIVYRDRIIGEGYHTHFGGPHAEVNAIKSVKDKSLLHRSTLYVNLEPCSHFGKTPPCTEMIIESGIPKVIIGSIDPNPEVCNRGVDRLKKCGTEVVTGVLEKDCVFLNRRFYTFHQKKRPYIILKWAQSPDGFIGTVPSDEQKDKPVWISNSTSRILVHKWRSEELAVMAGTNTILVDNPSLDVRDWAGENPLRVIPDRNGRLSESLKIFNNKSQTLVFTSSYNLQNREKYLFIPEENFSLSEMMEILNKKDILSILVEGGAILLKSFLDSGLWDEARIFTGNRVFTDGIRAPIINSMPKDSFYYHGDHFSFYLNENI